MEEQRFDDLARLVAQKTSRRQVLKVLAGAALGGMFANRLSPALAAGAGGCAQYCNQVFGKDTAATTQCIQDAKRGTGLCYSACGPGGSGGTVCGGPSYSSTTCCASGQTCQHGVCCASGLTGCSGTCVDTQSDFNNCGSCGHVCGSNDAECLNGVCGCFTGETLIAMADGTSRPIERVEIGDLVLGDGGAANEVLQVHTPLLGNRSLYGFNGGSAFVTSGHPFMTEEGWKSIDPAATATTNPDLPVARLGVGDRLLSLTGVAVPVGGMPTSGETVEVRIESVPMQRLEGRSADAETQLYNLRLDGTQTYFANGLLVHNK